ncbi:polyketide synthase PksL domain protein [Burkholderia pseudomallei MSHR4303]|nr:polyketide synthase PksL domain protein [Burkholderia pseudomallei MSHR4303]
MPAHRGFRRARRRAARGGRRASRRGRPGCGARRAMRRARARRRPRRRSRTDRDRRHVGPLSGRARSRRVLGEPRGRAQRDRRDSREPVGRRAPLRRPSRDARQGLQQMDRPPGRRRLLRSGVFPDLARRGAGDGSAAPVVPAGRLSGLRERRLFGRYARRPQLRRLSRHHEPGVPAARRERRGHDAREEQQLRDRRRAARLSPEPEGAGDSRRHRVLVRARRDPSRVPGAARGRDRHGARGRRHAVPVARRVHRDVLVGHAVAGRPLQGLRRFGGRLRAGRGRRRRRAQAPRRRAARRRSDHRDDHRLGHQSGRQDERHHRAEHGEPVRARVRRPRPVRHRSGDDPLCRGARHGHEAGRSDRADGARRRVSRAHRADRLLRARFGEEQHRPHVGGRGRRRPAQGAALHAAPHARADAALRRAEPAFRFRRVAVLCEHRARALGAARRVAAPRSGQLVRFQRHQRASRRRGIRASRRGGARGRRAVPVSAVRANPRATRGVRRAIARPRAARRARGRRARGSRLYAPGRAQADGRAGRADRAHETRTRRVARCVRRRARRRRRADCRPARPGRRHAAGAVARGAARARRRGRVAHDSATVGARRDDRLGMPVPRPGRSRAATPDRGAVLPVRAGALLAARSRHAARAGRARRARGRAASAAARDRLGAVGRVLRRDARGRRAVLARSPDRRPAGDAVECLSRDGARGGRAGARRAGGRDARDRGHRVAQSADGERRRAPAATARAGGTRRARVALRRELAGGGRRRGRAARALRRRRALRAARAGRRAGSRRAARAARIGAARG